jgi:hypothetical protein
MLAILAFFYGGQISTFIINYQLVLSALATIFPIAGTYAIVYNSKATASRDEISIRSTILHNYFKHKEEYIKKISDVFKEHFDIEQAHGSLFPLLIYGNYDVSADIINKTNFFLKSFICSQESLGVHPFDKNDNPAEINNWLGKAKKIQDTLSDLFSIHSYAKRSTPIQKEEVKNLLYFLKLSLELISFSKPCVKCKNEFLCSVEFVYDGINRCERHIKSCRDLREMLTGN